MTPADRELERAMRSVPPMVALLNPAAAAFAAGRASASRRLRLWQATTALALIAGIVPRIIPAAAPRPSHDSPHVTFAIDDSRPLADQSVPVLNRAVLDRGLDGLPAQRLPSIDLVPRHDSL
jgi:hypothetical protein